MPLKPNPPSAVLVVSGKQNGVSKLRLYDGPHSSFTCAMLQNGSLLKGPRTESRNALIGWHGIDPSEVDESVTLDRKQLRQMKGRRSQ